VAADPRSAPPAPAIVGRLLEPLYRAIVRRRNAAFDRGERVTRFEAPVISVGNLSVGGTGKTPLTMWILERLREDGLTPALAMRGYRSRATGQSDEADEYDARLADLPIVAQPDRVAGLRALINARRREGIDPIDAIILDDGFQHRFIARDLDILLLDASRDPFEDRCLPAGWLREPLESMARASLVVITHAELASEHEQRRLRERIREVAEELPVVVTAHEWSGLEGESGPLDVETLRGARIVTACGIGHPGAFVEAAKRAGADVADSITLRDHAAFGPREAQLIRAALDRTGAEAALVTGKDWVKLARAADDALRARIWRTRLAMTFLEGEERLRELLRDAVSHPAPVSSSES